MTETTRKILFLTGTRADFGKLKSLMLQLQEDPDFDVHVFVTGMHMLYKYGYTYEEVALAGLRNIYKFINQNASDRMDSILAKTIQGLSDFVREMRPDMIVVHGDRIEALAGATVGALNNIRTSHIEGGEVSGTVDELIRHAVSKLSHAHFVSNNEAYRRLIQLGEVRDSVHIIGSPDIDVMNSGALPNLDEVRRRYEIPFERYAVLIFHPVTSEVHDLARQVSALVDAVLDGHQNYVVIYPNNDHGTEEILREYRRLEGNPRFRIFPSMRFEYFLSLLKNAEFMIGNSSAGVREAPHFGVPTINLGSRQFNRTTCDSVLNVDCDADQIRLSIDSIATINRFPSEIFGKGNSAQEFHRILKQTTFWKLSTQKYFKDQETTVLSDRR